MLLQLLVRSDTMGPAFKIDCGSGFSTLSPAGTFSLRFHSEMKRGNLRVAETSSLSPRIEGKIAMRSSSH